MGAPPPSSAISSPAGVGAWDGRRLHEEGKLEESRSRVSLRWEGAAWLHALRSLEASLGHGIEGRGPGQHQQHLPTEDIGRMALSPGNGHHGDKQPLLGMETPPHPTTATDVVWSAHDGHKPAVHHWRPVQIPDLSRTLCSPGSGNMVKMFGTRSWGLAARSCTSALPVTLCNTKQVPHLCTSISSNGGQR